MSIYWSTFSLYLEAATGGVLLKKLFLQILQYSIHKKTPVLESLLSKVAGLKALKPRIYVKSHNLCQYNTQICLFSMTTIQYLMQALKNTAIRKQYPYRQSCHESSEKYQPVTKKAYECSFGQPLVKTLR